jgi:hypothetical protein
MSKNKNIITKLRIKASVAMMSKKKLRQYVRGKRDVPETNKTQNIQKGETV